MKNGYKPCKTGANGTSFHDVIVEASLERLLRLFGKPAYEDIDGKVTREWILKGPRGEYVTVYDYKYDGASAGYWHVGGKNKLDELAFADWFNGQV